MGLIELLVLILIIAWIGGFSLNIAGSFIHILLVVALIIFVFNFLSRQR